MTTTEPRISPPRSWADSADSLARGRLIPATLPSGGKVVVRTLTLDELAAEESLPDDLLRAAMLDRTVGIRFAMYEELRNESGEGLERAQQLSAANAEVVKRLARRALVEPVLTDAQFDELDPSDLDMIASISQRRLGSDAAGRVIGVVPLDVFAPFPAEHGCAPDCPSCANARVALSEVRGG